MHTAPQVTLKQPLGVRLVGVFLLLATGILAATVITLFFPGTVVDVIWRVKPEEYAQLLTHRFVAGAGFLALGIMMAIAAVGWWRSHRWGWWLAQGIFAANALGDLGRAASGDVLAGLFGAGLVLALILYVRSASVRAVFTR